MSYSILPPEVMAKDFGFEDVGEGGDCTTAFQLALDYCASSPNPRVLRLPPGDFFVSSVRSNGVSIIGGAWASCTRNGGRTGTVLRQPHTADGHMITLEGRSSRLSGVEIVMNGEGTARNKVPIQLASGRLSFHVLSVDAPTVVDGINSYCQFFSAGGRHLGFGIVQSKQINPSIGMTRILLVPGSDCYASPNGRLDLSMQVRFTRDVSTTWVDGSEITALSPAAMGFAGVCIAHNQAAPNYTEPMCVSDCVIRNGHCGILLETTVAPRIRDTVIANSHFANIAPLHMNSGADGRMSGVTVQGHYVSCDYPAADEAVAYADQAFRQSRFGIIPRAMDQISLSLVEYCVEPFLVYADGVTINQATVEAGYMGAVNHAGGHSLMVNLLTVRTDPVKNHPQSAVIRSGPNASAAYNMLSVVRYGAGYYNQFQNQTPENSKVFVGMVLETTGLMNAIPSKATQGLVKPTSESWGTCAGVV